MYHEDLSSSQHRLHHGELGELSRQVIILHRCPLVALEHRFQREG